MQTLPEPCVGTGDGPVFASKVVLATGAPILDRGLYFAKVSAARSAPVPASGGGGAIACRRG